jgi:small redox-active disulfide protein 2
MENVKAAVATIGVDAQIEKVTDINAITGFGVMTTPALVIDGEVKVVGKVPSVDEIEALLS